MGEFLNSLLRGLIGGFSEPTARQDVFAPTEQPARPVSSLRNERLFNEIMMIAPRFSNVGGIFYDEENCDWIMIPKYALPDRWEERWCQLLIVPPATYPETPPIGFYLNKRFRLRTGGADPHATGQAYHGAPNLLPGGWHWYCVRTAEGAGGWKPTADYRQPDNLWTFLNMVRESLTNDF
jgi:hypothetical protein